MMFAWLVACDDTPKRSTNPEVPDLPSVVMPDTETGVLSAEWTGEDLEAVFESHSANGIPSATPFMESYFALLAEGDENCPGSPTRLSPDNVEGCVASTGYAYYGLSVYETIFDEMDEPNENLEPVEGWIIIGDFEVLTPTQASFQAGGHVTEFLWQDRLGRDILDGEIQGSWRWEDGTHDWQAHGISGLFTYEVFQEKPNVEIDLNGALQWNGQSIAFRDVFLLENTPGFIGTVQIRDPSGLWHDLESESLESACASHTYANVLQETPVCLNWEHYVTHFKSLIGGR